MNTLLKTLILGTFFPLSKSMFINSSKILFWERSAFGYELQNYIVLNVDLDHHEMNYYYIQIY